jgi:hypothetical protein
VSIEDRGTVDAIGIEKSSGEAVLTISDHLDWAEEEPHLLLLQEKLNTYLAFFESGEILESYPASSGLEHRIEIVFRVPPSEGARRFLEVVRPTLSDAGLGLSWRLLPES